MPCAANFQLKQVCELIVDLVQILLQCYLRQFHTHFTLLFTLEMGAQDTNMRVALEPIFP